MKISKKTDYALRALFTIAEVSKEGTISIRELSESVDIPRRFLENIMLEMNKAGWVKSTPGRNGGYTLARDANEITLGEVIRYFEGMVAMITCVSVSNYEPCSQEGKCYFRRVFLNIRNLTAQILDRTTIASSEESLVSIRELSESVDVPRRFLENIMLEMNKAGWVKSITGRNGGYALARDASKITLGEVIRHFEGMVAMISCVSVYNYEPCSQEGKCYFRRVFLNIRNLTAQILDKTTIASCLAHEPVTKEDLYKEEFIGGLGI